MGYHNLGRAQEHWQGLSNGARLVVNYLAYWSHDIDADHPEAIYTRGIEPIARMLGKSRRTAQHRLDECRAAGAIETVRHSAPGQHSAHYRVHLQPNTRRDSACEEVEHTPTSGRTHADFWQNTRRDSASKRREEDTEGLLVGDQPSEDEPPVQSDERYNDDWHGGLMRVDANGRFIYRDGYQE